MPAIGQVRVWSANRTDGEAIAASLTEPRAFGVVFERHFGVILRYLRRRLDDQPAEEATAQTFFVAFDERGRFDRERADARPWLFGIATNVARRHRRSEVRELRAIAALAGEATTADDGAEAKLDAERMRGASPAAWPSCPPRSPTSSTSWSGRNWTSRRSPPRWRSRSAPSSPVSPAPASGCAGPSNFPNPTRRPPTSARAGGNPMDELTVMKGFRAERDAEPAEAREAIWRALEARMDAAAAEARSFGEAVAGAELPTPSRAPNLLPAPPPRARLRRRNARARRSSPGPWSSTPARPRSPPAPPKYSTKPRRTRPPWTSRQP